MLVMFVYCWFVLSQLDGWLALELAGGAVAGAIGEVVAVEGHHLARHHEREDVVGLGHNCTHTRSHETVNAREEEKKSREHTIHQCVRWCVRLCACQSENGRAGGTSQLVLWCDDLEGLFRFEQHDALQPDQARTL